MSTRTISMVRISASTLLAFCIVWLLCLVARAEVPPRQVIDDAKPSDAQPPICRLTRGLGYDLFLGLRDGNADGAELRACEAGQDRCMCDVYVGPPVRIFCGPHSDAYGEGEPDAGQPAAVAGSPVAPAQALAPDAGEPPAPTDEQALAAAADAAKKLGGASALNGADRRKAILGGLASLFLFLIWAVRRWSNLLLNDQAVRALAALLGVAVFLLSAVACDQPLWASIEIAMAGPAALALHEIGKLGRPASWLRAKAKVKAASAAPAPPVA